MLNRQSILRAPLWLLLLAWAHTIAITGMAQLPLPDAFNPAAEGTVSAMAVQRDGKIVVGGSFISVGGWWYPDRRAIGRLNPDGSPDIRFAPVLAGEEWYDVSVSCLLIQADGKILISGRFSSVNGENRANLARLNPDGSLDSGFNPGVNGFVSCVALQADGKILLGGDFGILGGANRSYIVRLNPSGTIDTNFNPGADGFVYAFATQPDGRIVVGGEFSELNGQSRQGIGRLESNGALDATFAPELFGGVYALALQPDGKIIVGGEFCVSFPDECRGLGRLNSDGTLDINFTATTDGFPNTLFVQTDGKILVGGISTLNGQTHEGIARLNSDSTLDESFSPSMLGFCPICPPQVYCLALQVDGKILVGGRFTKLGEEERLNIGRLNNTDPATQELAYTNSTLTWNRGGTSPEVSRVNFETLSGDNTWTNLGVGVRIAGGWQLTGVALPANPRLRARGYATDGARSTWFADSEFNQPLRILNSEYQAYFRLVPFFEFREQHAFFATGPIGETAIVEASPDLQAWTPIGTNLISSGSLFFADQQIADYPSRFYRLRLGP